MTKYMRDFLEKAIADELEAIALYERMAEESPNPIVSEILQHVADEEKKHFWMFTYALQLIDKEFERQRDIALKEDLDILSRSGYCSYDGKKGLLRCNVSGVVFETHL